MELERVRAKAKAAEAKRKAATTAAASKRYDADVLFRYDAQSSAAAARPGNRGTAGKNVVGNVATTSLPYNDPTANEVHARFLKRFFK